ncbi:MAG: LPXTG cell wall anchor domain-containing protein [Nanoarchaeota archaeon]|nr:LPXTG cell wall anchor domain-containing protein [Nanoarchaeota archaeon]
MKRKLSYLSWVGKTTTNKSYKSDLSKILRVRFSIYMLFASVVTFVLLEVLQKNNVPIHDSVFVILIWGSFLCSVIFFFVLIHSTSLTLNKTDFIILLLADIARFYREGADSEQDKDEISRRLRALLCSMPKVDISEDDFTLEYSSFVNLKSKLRDLPRFLQKERNTLNCQKVAGMLTSTSKMIYDEKDPDEVVDNIDSSYKFSMREKISLFTRIKENIVMILISLFILGFILAGFIFDMSKDTIYTFIGLVLVSVIGWVLWRKK